MRRRSRVVTVATLVALVGAACDTSVERTSDGAVVVNAPVAPSTLDPAGACATEDSQLTYALYAQLVRFGSKEGPNGSTEQDQTKIRPYFAKRWSVSPDGRVYTFELNRGWKFASGRPMDAAAVKYSLERVLKMGTCATTIINDLFDDPELVRRIETPDRYTVKIHLAHRDENFLSAVAESPGSIVDPSVVEANGGVRPDTLNKYMQSHAAASGPYRLASYTPNEEAVLEANPGFQGPRPGSREIQVNWIDSQSTLFLQAQDGTADVTYGLTPRSAEALQSSHEVDVNYYQGTRNMQLLMPNDKDPWKDPKVREAVVRALPYESIIDSTLAGHGEQYYGPIPPVMKGYAERSSAPVEYDLDRARELMDDARVSGPLNVSLDILQGDDVQETLATLIQDNLSRIGIDVTVNKLNSSAWSDAVYTGKSEMALRLDGPAIFDAGYYLEYDMTCDSTSNTAHVCIPKNDAILKQARMTRDADEAERGYAAITKNWRQGWPKAVLYQQEVPVAVSAEMREYFWSQKVDMTNWRKS